MITSQEFEARVGHLVRLIYEELPMNSALEFLYVKKANTYEDVLVAYQGVLDGIRQARQEMGDVPEHSEPIH